MSAGFTIERHDRSNRYARMIAFRATALDGRLIEILLFQDDVDLETPGPVQISWPSTGDKRPLVARALREALRLALAEVDAIERPGAEPTREQENAVSAFCSREGGEPVSMRTAYDPDYRQNVTVATTRDGRCEHYGEDGDLLVASPSHNHEVDWSEV